MSYDNITVNNAKGKGKIYNEYENLVQSKTRYLCHSYFLFLICKRKSFLPISRRFGKRLSARVLTDILLLKKNVLLTLL